MADTVDEVARSALNLLETDATLLQAREWVSQRYRRVASRGRLQHLRQLGVIEVPAPIATGTVTATRDSSTIIGVGTTFPTAAKLDSGWYFNVKNVWYEIAVVISDTELRLKTPYTEDTQTGVAFEIVKRFHTLPNDVRWLDNNMYDAQNFDPVHNMPQSILDARDPARVLGSASYTTVWSEVTINEFGDRIVEIYPYPSKSRSIAYVFWKDPPKLKPLDRIPGFIDAEMLMDGVLIDIAFYNASLAAKGGSLEIAAFWRNEANTLKTRWEREVLETIRKDYGPEAITMVREFATPNNQFERIPTAEGHVVSKW